MLTDIPSANDFQVAGISLLNLAWGTVIPLYTDVEESELEEWDGDGTISDEFWSAAQQPLANGFTLCQQGIEFLLKAKIASISPYLLLFGGPRDWPAYCQLKDMPYADFRTVDAQDLEAIHDTVCEERLDQAFKQRLQSYRRTRNVIVHTVDKRLRHSPLELWCAILDATHNLVGEVQWPKLRRAYLEKSPTSVLYTSDHVAYIHSWENMKLLKLLQPAEKKLYLGVNPKLRRYICYDCSIACRDSDHLPSTAQLRPNSANSTQIYCFVCDHSDKVVRKRCSTVSCKGNVIHAQDDVCLTCYDSQT